MEKKKEVVSRRRVTTTTVANGKNQKTSGLWSSCSYVVVTGRQEGVGAARTRDHARPSAKQNTCICGTPAASFSSSPSIVVSSSPS